jgi:endonuclease/exonuclease/phosphatase family metal-dependent hydrolase
MLKSIPFLLLPYLAISQPVLFYNVENLFDTINDYGYADEDFLPEGPRHNNSMTYWLKIRQTARALRLAHVQSPSPPLVIGLAEVETYGALLALSRHAALRSLGPWQPVLFDSRDSRGIDVAALVHEEVVILQSQTLRMPESWRTRDPLFLRLQWPDSSLSQLIFIHLPSKRGGAQQSDHKRMRVLEKIMNSLDSCQTPTLLAGDFNTDPTPSIMALAGEHEWALATKQGEQQGTYKFRGRWHELDWALMKNGEVSGQILTPDALLEADRKWGGRKPKRSWIGHRFSFGYSDHLPVYYLICGN